MASAAAPTAPCVLVFGDDEYGVKQRAREIFNAWAEKMGGTDHDIIDGAAANSGDALKALAKLNESLQTLPFFGGGKVVWLKNCAFLGDERTASAQAVTEALARLAQTLKTFRWDNVRLIISAGKVDKRKAFYKTLEKLGAVEAFAGWSAEDRDWEQQAEAWAARALRERKKEISDEALSKMIEQVGPHVRQLASEIEKLCLFVGERAEITLKDVETIVTCNKQSKAFALADALGARDLPKLLRCLDEELWEMRRDPQRSEIGLLYGLISKVRVLILVKEMLAAKLIKAETDYNRFKSQLTRIPPGLMPEDKRFNPLAINAFIVFKAVAQTRNYTSEELVRAMDTLLECNQKLVSRGLDEALVLQEALVSIASRPTQPGTRCLTTRSQPPKFC
jgi:DNA polymerase-3 subunit delta